MRLVESEDYPKRLGNGIAAREQYLNPGRSIAPRPTKSRWRFVGAPIRMQIANLDLHPDGLATARSKWSWEPNFVHTNNEPVKAVMVDGMYHVIDGYHRVVQAARDGQSDILVQPIK